MIESEKIEKRLELIEKKLDLFEKKFNEIARLPEEKSEESTPARPVSDDEIIKYVLSLEKESLVYPSDLVIEFGIDFERAEEILENLVKGEKLEIQ